MKSFINLLLIFLATKYLSAKNQSDTIYDWKLKFAKLTVPIMSPQGKWLAIKKFYRHSSDTVFIVSVQNQAIPAQNLSCLGIPTFLGDDGILGLSTSKAEFINLNTKTKYTYKDIMYIYTLQESKMFALLTKDNRIQLYNHLGQKIREISDIEGPGISDSLRKLYIKRKNGNVWQILELSEHKENVIYSTANTITKILLSPSGEQLFITENSVNEESDQLIVVDVKNFNNKLLNIKLPKKAELSIHETKRNKSYLINAKVRANGEKNSLVNIWYGNDPFVNEEERLVRTDLYWTWNIQNTFVNEIKNSKGFEFRSFNNSRYMFSFIPRKDHNYLTSAPQLNDLQLLDLKTGTYKNLGDLRRIDQMNRVQRIRSLNEEIIYALNSKWFLASNDGRKWTVFNDSGEKESLIDMLGLEQPVFSHNGNEIFFESSNGLWNYNIKKKKLTSISISIGKMSRIKNKKTVKNGPLLMSYLSTDKLLLENYDVTDNTTSYSMLCNGKWKIILPTTANKINDLVYDHEMNHFISLQENYNLAPALYSHALDKQPILFYDGRIKDNGAKNIKQEILSYSAIKENLNGILYYPRDFDSKKRYPMVVHIYEVQRPTSNEYLSPNNDTPVGFQIRTLLERGYFVYLPDIRFGFNGTGVSALECVNKALDVALKKVYIDSTKVGLIGHSHGGYETNFIATHSNRFKTYISGAGNSDIIRSYYSYNFNFGKPFYFQFENGQYQMGTSVAEDKDRYLKNSPILQVEKVNAPILLWSGRKDENIATDQVTEFYIGLRRYHKDVIALFYPNGGHSFLNESPEERDLNIRILEWCDYFLKNEQDIPWISKQIRKDAQ